MSDVKRTRKPDMRKGDRHRPGYWIEYGRLRRARGKKPTPPSKPQKDRADE